MEVPTVIVGAPQSGKTFRAFRLFEAHPGPAIFYDTQWRGRDYSPGSPRARTVQEVVSALASWSPGDAPPRIVWEPLHHGDFPVFVDALLRLHLSAHVADSDLPALAFFVDEVSILADNRALPDNPAVRLIREAFQHRIIGCAITQRPAATTRHITENAWEAYIFNPGPIGAETLEAYGWRVPDWTWVTEPRSYRYWHYSDRWLKGDAGGVEVEVAQVSQVQGPAPDALPEPQEPGDGKADAPGVGQDGVPPVREGLQPGPPGRSD